MKKLMPILLSLTLALILFACDAAQTPTTTVAATQATAAAPAVTTAQPSATTTASSARPSPYREAPSLAEKVRSGDLPPVEERLPDEPVVIDAGYYMPGTMDDLAVGAYGGELRVSRNEPNTAPDVFFMVMQPIIRLPNGLSTGEIQDNICHFLGVSENNTLFTFRIRDGIKWSDGVPVTMEDIRFAYEDVTMNADITPSVPGWLALDGQAGKLEIVDESTFAFRFHKPHGSFVRQVMINEWIEYTRIIKPAHYLKQFHPDYADKDELNRLLGYFKKNMIR
jgi:peptide/nickel transport system substrate-binding protein